MNATRWSPLSRLAGEAAVSESELRFANGSTPSTDSQGTSQVIYGLAQCTRDLNASECMRCLTTLMAGLSSSSPSNTYGTAATAVPATPVDDSPTKINRHSPAWRGIRCSA